VDTLVDIHSILRWLVLAVLLGGGIVGLAASRRPGAAFRRPVFSVAAIVVDVQVTLGIVLYLFNEGWNEGGFIAVFHPIGMLLALGFVHALLARTRATAAEGHPGAANRIAGAGLLVALVIVVGAIPWQR
jgi:hypothetical protein